MIVQREDANLNRNEHVGELKKEEDVGQVFLGMSYSVGTLSYVSLLSWRPFYV